MMTNDLFRAWALQQLEEHMRRNMPSAKAVRDLKTSQRSNKKELVRMNRAFSARRAAINRRFRERQQEIETASRKRQLEMDAADWKRRLDLLSGSPV